MFESFGAWLMLPFGIALGWYLAQRAERRHAGGPHDAGKAPVQYAVDPDEALAALLDATTTDPRSVALQTSLGVLFRKRGEVDRALRVHEGLLQREDLEPKDREQLRFELAEDYARAGMIDRAQTEFQALADEGILTAACLEALRTLYEQEHEWEKALDANERFAAASGSSQHKFGAQYCCELAAMAQQDGQSERALEWAQRGSELDRDAPRPWILIGQLREQAGQPAEASEAFYRAIEADARFLPEVLEPLWRCEQAAGHIEAFLHFLGSEHPAVSGSAVLLKRAELTEASGLDSAAFLAESFAAHPSWALLERLVGKIELPPEAPLAPALDSLREALAKAAKRRPRYRCGHCGLQPGLLFWQCPSCRHWGSVAPVDDAIAD